MSAKNTVRALHPVKVEMTGSGCLFSLDVLDLHSGRRVSLGVSLLNDEAEHLAMEILRLVQEDRKNHEDDVVQSSDKEHR